MNATIEQINEVGGAFVEFALPMLVQSGVLILILLLVDLLLRSRVRAVFRYWMWMLVLVKLVLPTSLSSPVSVGRWFGDELVYVDVTPPAVPEPRVDLAPMPVAEGPPVADISSLETLRRDPAVFPPEPTPQPVEPTVAETAHPPSPSAMPLSWQGAVFLAWLAVLVGMVLVLLQRAVYVERLVTKAAPADGGMADLLARCCERIAVRRKVGLKISAEATSPAVCGLFHPVILVPKNLTPSLSSGELRVVLLHELAHIKRRDLWVNLAQTILQIFYFYNPLLWLANALIRRAREQAVDEMVMVAMGEKARQYPQTLVNVAKLAFKRPVLSLRLIGVVESKSALSGRIKHILGRPIPKTAKLGILGLLIIVVIATILLPMAAFSPGPPELIVRGVVRDAQTGEPIAGVKVFDDGYGPGPSWDGITADQRSEWGAITNSAGEYSFLTWPEHHSIRVEAPGYAVGRESLYDSHFTFRKKDEETIDFDIGPEAVEDTPLRQAMSTDLPAEAEDRLFTIHGTVTDQSGNIEDSVSVDVEPRSNREQASKGIYRWRIDPPKEYVLDHGWFSLIDGEMKEHAGGGRDRSGTKKLAEFGLDTSIEEGFLVLKTQKFYQDQNAAVTCRTPVPQGSQLESEHLSRYRPMTNTQYRSLWEGRFVRNGETVKTVVYCARIAALDDEVEGFYPEPAGQNPDAGLGVPKTRVLIGTPRRPSTRTDAEMSGPAAKVIVEQPAGNADIDVEHDEVAAAGHGRLVVDSRRNDFSSLDESNGSRIEKRIYDELVRWSEQQGYQSEIFMNLVPWEKHNTFRGEFWTFRKTGWTWNKPKRDPPDVFLKVDLVKDGIWYVQGIEKQPKEWSSSLRLELLVAERGQTSADQYDTLRTEARRRFSAVRKPNSKWTTLLSNGAQVELVGISNFPSPGKQWWAPDGSQMGYDPVFHIQDYPQAYEFRRQRGLKRFEVAFAISWPKCPNENKIVDMFTDDVKHLNRGGSQADNEVIVQPVKFAANQKTFDVKIRISSDGKNFETATFKNVLLTPNQYESASGEPGHLKVDVETSQRDDAKIVGRVVDGEGRPVAGAQVALSTDKIGVQVSHGKFKSMPGNVESRIVETDSQGGFDLGQLPDGSFDLISVHDKGFALVGSEDYLVSREIRLRLWGRIEGQLAPGRHASESKIWMAGSPNSTWFLHKGDYSYETVCDSDGHFVFEKVPAGWFEAGYLIKTGEMGASITSRTPFEVKAGETTRITLGGSGRPVIGRFVPPEDYDKPVYFGNGLRSLGRTRPDEPRPENYDRMTRREQQQWRAQWRESDEFRQYRDAYWHDPNWRQYTFRIGDDGSFRIEDVIAGKYDFTVWIEERITGAGRPDEIASYYGKIEVPQMPGGRSDEPLDLGDLELAIHEPLRVGDTAPLFEAKTLDGKDLKLIDYHGKFVLLSFWQPVSHPEKDRLRELYDTYNPDGRLEIIGLAGHDTLDEVRNYLEENPIPWPQIYTSEEFRSGIAKDYRIPGWPWIFLIDPDGKIVATGLRGESLRSAVSDSLGEAARVEDEKADSVLCKLQANKAIWDQNEAPVLSLGLANHGNQPVDYWTYPALRGYDIEIDGRWHRWAAISGGGAPSRRLNPGEAIDDAIDISLNGPWVSLEVYDKLVRTPGFRSAPNNGLLPGKHTIRARLWYSLPDAHKNAHVRGPNEPCAISNPVEIEISWLETTVPAGLKREKETLCRTPGELMDRFLELARIGDPAAGELCAENVAPEVTRLLKWWAGEVRCNEMAAEYHQMRAELLAGLTAERRQFYAQVRVWADRGYEVTQVGTRAYGRLLKSNQRGRSWVRILLMGKARNGEWQITGLFDNVGGMNLDTAGDYLNPWSPATHPAWGETTEYNISADDLARGCYIDFDDRTLHRMTPGSSLTRATCVRLGIDGKCGSREVGGGGGLAGIDLLERSGHFTWGLITPLNVQLASSLWQGLGSGGGGPLLIKTREGGIGVMGVSGDVNNYYIKFKMLNPACLGSTGTILRAVQADPRETAAHFLVGGLCRDGELDVSSFAQHPELITKVKSNGVPFGPRRLDIVCANSGVALAVTSKFGGDDYRRFVLRLSKEADRWLVTDVQIEMKEQDGEALRDFLREHPDARAVPNAVRVEHTADANLK